MSSCPPISHHLDLYDYWLTKRAGRSMPARRDLDPCDIPKLLPYLGLVNKVDNQFCWRLVGSAAVQEFGGDPTGYIVGSSAPEATAAAQVLYERVFTTAHPIFSTGEFRTQCGAIQNISVLVLPLSADGADVNMAVSTLIARFNFDVSACTGRPKVLAVKVREMTDIDSAADLERCCLDWDRYCDDQRRRAEAICRDGLT